MKETISQNGRQEQIVPVVELNGSSHIEAVRICEILNSTDNRPHFANPYTVPEGVLATSETNNGTHVLVSRNESGLVVATATIHDTTYPQNDHFLSLFAVDQDYQGKGYGRKMMREALQFAFTTPNLEGRDREAIHAATVMGVDGWFRMYQLLRTSSFIPGAIWPEQMENGNGRAYDVVRLFLQKKNWRP
ncbi:MAG: GNAT family N-acetyltransferase [Candidatus Roizmanbacteria bacterium]|nr:GNAT family N-acetyltransferase [Candidatus Roizmanbacteria bacterium]